MFLKLILEIVDGTFDGLLDGVDFVTKHILLSGQLLKFLLLQTIQLVQLSLKKLSNLVLDVTKLLEWRHLPWESDVDAGVALADIDGDNEQEEDEDSLHGSLWILFVWKLIGD